MTDPLGFEAKGQLKTVNQRFDEEWLKKSLVLEPSQDHIYVEIQEVDSGVVHTTEKKHGSELVALCSSYVETNAEWRLKLLVTPRIHYGFYGGTWRYLPYSLETVEALRTHWHIPILCFRQQGSCSYAFSPEPGDAGWEGFLLRFIYGLPFLCNLIVTHDITTRTTFALCWGAGPSEIDTFLSRLLLDKEYAFQPYLTSHIITDIALMRLERFSWNAYSDFLGVREAMGCNLYFHPPPKYEAPDVTEMPQRLTALANALASNTASVTAQLQVVECLEKQLRLHGTGEYGSKGNALMVGMRDQLESNRQVIKNTKRRNDYVKESVQAQVQMVYAVLAQKDNELNHQYGADMRVIAVVTLLFLPGTFVATLFSASFWDFSPKNNGPVVSNWVWIYWLVTVGLTVAVLGVWRIFPRMKKRRFWRRRPELGMVGKKEA